MELFDFGDQSETANVKSEIVAIQDMLRREGISPRLLITEMFNDRRVGELLISTSNEEQRFDYLKNSTLFDYLQSKDKQSIVSGEPCLYGEETTVLETIKADGTVRRAESGRKIDLDYARKNGIDVSKVLVFRATQPSDVPKPESYWTTDYFETVKGLGAEMGQKNRESAIILVSTLDKISDGGGLIMDINDDLALPVRRVSNELFDQKKAIGVIRPQA